MFLSLKVDNSLLQIIWKAVTVLVLQLQNTCLYTV